MNSMHHRKQNKVLEDHSANLHVAHVTIVTLSLKALTIKLHQERFDACRYFVASAFILRSELSGTSGTRDYDHGILLRLLCKVCDLGASRERVC